MNGWEIAIAVVGALIAIATTLSSSRIFRAGDATKVAHGEEEKDWESLRHDGQRAVAEIIALARPGYRLVTWRAGSPNMAAAELLIAFQDSDGKSHRVTLRTFIDEELLANFASGRSLPVVYADGQELRVAVDRERVQVVIRSAVDA